MIIDSITIDFIGYIALLINLYSMSVKGEKRLRFISTLANSLFVVYGILINAIPIIIGSSITIILHCYHLKRIRKHCKPIT